MGIIGGGGGGITVTVRESAQGPLCHLGPHHIVSACSRGNTEERGGKMNSFSLPVQLREGGGYRTAIRQAMGVCARRVCGVSGSHSCRHHAAM